MLLEVGVAHVLWALLRLLAALGCPAPPPPCAPAPAAPTAITMIPAVLQRTRLSANVPGCATMSHYNVPAVFRSSKLRRSRLCYNAPFQCSHLSFTDSPQYLHPFSHQYFSSLACSFFIQSHIFIKPKGTSQVTHF